MRFGDRIRTHLMKQLQVCGHNSSRSSCPTQPEHSGKQPVCPTERLCTSMTVGILKSPFLNFVLASSHHAGCFNSNKEQRCAAGDRCASSLELASDSKIDQSICVVVTNQQGCNPWCPDFSYYSEKWILLEPRSLKCNQGRYGNVRRRQPLLVLCPIEWRILRFLWVWALLLLVTRVITSIIVKSWRHITIRFFLKFLLQMTLSHNSMKLIVKHRLPRDCRCLSSHNGAMPWSHAYFVADEVLTAFFVVARCESIYIHGESLVSASETKVVFSSIWSRCCEQVQHHKTMAWLEGLETQKQNVVPYSTHGNGTEPIPSLRNSKEIKSLKNLLLDIST